MRIDAHQHFWRLARGDYGWLTPDLAPIYRDFGPADLAPLLERHSINATILVQAAPSEGETEYLLALARQTPWVAGVVGWVPLDEVGAAARIESLAAEDRLVGLRPMLHDLTDDDWILRHDVGRGLAAMERQGLVLDALVRPRHLPSLLTMLDRHPGLAVVVDHAAKPEIGAGRLGPWAADMTALAQRSQLSCKLSGLLTEAPAGASAEDLWPYVEHLLAVFGPGRLIWGSDWPVLNLAATYDAWLELTGALLSALSDAERAAVLGGNAAQTYLRRRKGPATC
jgi:L-fuconolactonase